MKPEEREREREETGGEVRVHDLRAQGREVTAQESEATAR